MDPQLQERIKQYEMAVAFAKEFIEELGEERALPIIARALEKMQIKAARQLAEKLGSNSLEALAEHYRRTAPERVLEVTDRHIALKIPRCLSWEAFNYLGAPEICRLYCNTDDAYIKAFNPRMKMIRTKTISNGDEYCDHIWALED